MSTCKSNQKILNTIYFLEILTCHLIFKFRQSCHWVLSALSVPALNAVSFWKLCWLSYIIIDNQTRVDNWKTIIKYFSKKTVVV